jgi:hypothetical protein
MLSNPRKRNFSVIGTSTRPGVKRPANEQGATSRVQTANLGPEMTNSNHVLLAANVNPEECAVRKEMAAHAIELLAPIVTNEEAFAIRPGQVCLAHFDPEAGIGRTQLNQGTCVTVTNTPAGLPTESQFFLPCISRINTHEGNQQQTVLLAGLCNFAHTGPQALACGDRVVVDPRATMITDPRTGNEVCSMIPATGIDKNFIPFTTRGMNPVKEQEWESNTWEDMLRYICTVEFETKFTNVKTTDEMCELISETCQTLIKDNYSLSESDPMRGWIELRTARQLQTMVMVTGADSIRDRGKIIQQTLIKVMRKLQKHHAHDAEKFLGCVPVRYRYDKDILDMDRHGFDLDSELIAKYMKDDALAWYEYSAVSAFVNHMYDYYMNLQGHRCRDYLGRHTLGMALTHTLPGKMCDGFL